MERRYYESNFEVGSGRTVKGYSVVFGQRSRPLKDKNGEIYYEVVDKGAVTDEIIKRNDVKAYMEHNNNRLLARSHKGDGTLSLTVDDIGLRFEFEAPNTSTGDEALELVRRGDIRGCSFAFWDAEYEFRREGGVVVRHIKKLPNLDDVTLTCRPAYDATSVEVRFADDEPKPTEVEVEDIYYQKLIVDAL